MKTMLKPIKEIPKILEKAKCDKCGAERDLPEGKRKMIGLCEACIRGLEIELKRNSAVKEPLR